MLAGLITFSQAHKGREEELMIQYIEDVLEESKHLLATDWYRMKYDAGDNFRADRIMRAGCDIFERKGFNECASKMYSDSEPAFK